MPTTIVPIGGEPTFYLNDLAETAVVGVSGERPVSEMDERPDVTYNVDGVINTLYAVDVQKWFQFIGGKASTDETYPNGGYLGDVMFGIKSNENCAFTDIPSESLNNTTLRFHQFNLQNDYLGTLAETVFGYAEGANLFSNVPQLKDNYNGALVEVIARTNGLMNDISSTIVNGVDVTKKLANTILKKYPERFELKFGAKIYTDSDRVPNGHLGYDSKKPPGNQTTEGWVFHRVDQLDNVLPQSDKAEALVTLSDQNTIVDMILTKEGNGYKFGDRLILCKQGQFFDETKRFIEFPSILDVQSTLLNQTLNQEDALFSTTDPKGADLSGNVQNFLQNGTNAYITNRLFLPDLTSDASVVCMDFVVEPLGLVTGTGSTVDVSCTPTGSYTDGSGAALFNQMTVTKRGGDLRYNAYAEGNTLTVSKNNATITHTLTLADAVKLNLGVLTVDFGKIIDSSAVFNTDSSGIVVSMDASNGVAYAANDVFGKGAIVDVQTDNFGTDISFNGVDGGRHIIVNTPGSNYVMGDRIQITNRANLTQTIDLSLTRMDAIFLNGLTILNLEDEPADITTRSMFSTDGRVPPTILCRVSTAAGSTGAIAEVEVDHNGTWVKKITVRDGSFNNLVDYAIEDTIVLTNMNGNVAELIELKGATLNADFIQALNAGEEYILTAPGDASGSTSLTDSSNALTFSLTAGRVFDNGETSDVVSYEEADGTPIPFVGGRGRGATVFVKTTGSFFEMPVFEIKVTGTGSGYVEGDMIRITRNFQTVIKRITREDAVLLNGDPKEIRGIQEVRTITSAKIFTDGAFGFATSANTDGSGALIRVDSDNLDTTITRLTVIIPDPSANFLSGDDVTIQNIEDPTQRIVFKLASEPVSQDELELNNTDSKILDILPTDIPYLFKGGVTKSVRAVKNDVDNKYSEAIVDITCDGSPDGNPDVGAKVEYITVATPAKPGTVGSQDELYYRVGDKVTFTVNEKGESINRIPAINQSQDGVATTIGSEFSIKYVITINSLTQEQADILNGILVGTNVPLLPGDVLAIKSTIESAPGVQDQPQFAQSFITKYTLR